jgi:hypothetical protein
VHVELTPGDVTILPAWKLDAVYCAGLKVGAPQILLSALCALHELLVANRGWSLRTAAPSRRRLTMGSLIQLTDLKQYGFSVGAVLDVMAVGYASSKSGTFPATERLLAVAADQYHFTLDHPNKLVFGSVCQ